MWLPSYLFRSWSVYVHRHLLSSHSCTVDNLTCLGSRRFDSCLRVSISLFEATWRLVSCACASQRQQICKPMFYWVSTLYFMPCSAISDKKTPRWQGYVQDTTCFNDRLVGPMCSGLLAVSSTDWQNILHCRDKAAKNFKADSVVQTAANLWLMQPFHRKVKSHV